MAYNLCRHFSRVLSRKAYSPSLVYVRGVKRWFAPMMREIKRRNKLYKNSMSEKEWLQLGRRSNFLEWNHGAEVYAFGKRLNEDFDLTLLTLAFTNKSYFDKQSVEDLNLGLDNIEFEHNEGLSEIGGKIISDHVWNYISHVFPRFPLEGIEGVHDHLTSVETLAHVSKNIGTTDLILSADYPVEEETYARTLKAIVGALNKSQGIEKANTLVRDLIVTQLAGKDVNDYFPASNYMDILAEITKRDGAGEPEPRIIFQSAKNEILANYHIGIYCNKQLFGHGSGESIQIAIDMAALDALKRLFHTTESSRPVRYDLSVSGEGKSYRNMPLSEWTSSKFADTAT